MGNAIYEFTPEMIAAIEDSQDLIVWEAEDEEVTIEIVDFLTDKEGSIVRINKDNFPYVMPSYEIRGTGEDEKYKSISTYVGLPTDGMETKKLSNTANAYRKFLTAHDIKLVQEADFRDWIGSQAMAYLKVNDDPEFGKRNEIMSFVAGK